MKMRKLYLIVLFVGLFFSLRAQDERLERVRNLLDQVAVADTSYRSEVDLSIGNMPLGDLIRNVAKVNRVSVSVKGDNNMMVNCNLSRARITDLLYFLCKEYNLDLDVVGNIVSIHPYVIPPPQPPQPKVTYDRDSARLSYDLIDAPLYDVTRKIADASGINIVLPQALYQKKVSGYAVGLPVAAAVQSLAETNGLDCYKNPQGLWTLSVKAPETQASGGNPVRRREFTGTQLEVDSLGRINIQIQQGNVYDIICNLCDKLGLNYYFISPVSAQTSLYLKEVELNTLLKVLFTGTSYSYYEEEGIYMFGTSKENALTSTRIVPMKYRTVDKLIDVIPANLKNGVQIQMFGDQNSIILSGDQRQVARVEQFLKSIDKTVPLITIDVMIVDATKNIINEVGLSLGVGTEPVATTGTLSPGIDMKLGASAINKILNSFNGFGSVNLGRVTPNFYAGLQMLEENGTIVLQSTPKLSTLNGHEAMLKSGETRYYKEVNQNLIGTQNPIQSSSYVWKTVDANLIVKIVPFVSGNEDITLTIEIEQSEFTPTQSKETEDAPPGTATRSFKSEIRVRNEEMVLLGGIDKNDRTKSTSGLPYVARVPVLKWIFGKTKDNNSVRKLSVFIKPTVIY